jgi:hypothetical protein
MPLGDAGVRELPEPVEAVAAVDDAGVDAGRRSGRHSLSPGRFTLSIIGFWTEGRTSSVRRSTGG